MFLVRLLVMIHINNILLWEASVPRVIACSPSGRQDSNFESCVWRTVSSHHPQQVLLTQFSLYVHKGGLKTNAFHFYVMGLRPLLIFSSFSAGIDFRRQNLTCGLQILIRSDLACDQMKGRLFPVLFRCISSSEADRMVLFSVHGDMLFK